jgi:hypothetical protein
MASENTKQKPVIKSESTNASESFLYALCKNNFLSLWSYPRVFRNQGKVGNGDGKELCDLLVLCGDDIIIFSDKYCEFQNNKDQQIAWNRWFKKTVANSAKQAWGAERWIRSYPDRVFLDNKCTETIPIGLEITEKTRFHLIVVAHGISKHIEENLGESGSLMIQSDLKGIEAHTRPFTVGDLNPSRSFVHVLDDLSLITLMKMRDTVTDFVHYIKKKEDLIRNRPYEFFSTGEEELLGVYLTNINEKNEHDFIFPTNDRKEPNAIFLGPGPWEEFINSNAYKSKVESDKVSYIWDSLIEKIGYHALTGTQYRSSPEGIKGTEKAARFMALEPRHNRRALSMSWKNMFERTSLTQRRLRVHLASTPDEPTYIFLLFPVLPENIDMPEDEYRTMRSNYLNAVCMVARKTYPQLTHVVAIATESGLNSARSEDFGYFDATDWNDEMEKEAEDLQKDLGILVKPEPMHVHISEYPSLVEYKKSRRNDPCPCRSGKKYKKCCIERPTYNW